MGKISPSNGVYSRNAMQFQYQKNVSVFFLFSSLVYNKPRNCNSILATRKMLNKLENKQLKFTRKVR